MRPALAPTDVLDAGIAGARAFFTTRAGGVSTGPKASLNLARHVEDDPAAVTENRRRVEEMVGRRLVAVSQVHGTGVLVLPARTAEQRTDAAVHAPGRATGRGTVPGAAPDDGGTPFRPPAEADAIVTDRVDVALLIMVADCVPVLLSDPVRGVVAVAHAGRRGLLAGILPETLAAMTSLGADTADVRAVIGPCICGACYEVPEDMAGEADDALPGSAARTRAGSHSIDLRAGARISLGRAGVRDGAILTRPECTLEDQRLFSHRRDARTGRFAGVMALDGRESAV